MAAAHTHTHTHRKLNHTFTHTHSHSVCGNDSHNINKNERHTKKILHFACIAGPEFSEKEKDYVCLLERESAGKDCKAAVNLCKSKAHAAAVVQQMVEKLILIS